MKKSVIENTLLKVFYQVGKELIETAIEHSTELAGTSNAVFDSGERGVTNNLTGNTKYGYVVGLYVNKKLYGRLITSHSSEISNGGKPIIGMVRPGRQKSSFVDIDSGEIVKTVKNYGEDVGDFVWQPTKEGRFAWTIASAYLQKEYHPTSNLEMLMVNGAPYGKYLQEKRELDIMTTASMEASVILRSKISAAKVDLSKI